MDELPVTLPVPFLRMRKYRGETVLVVHAHTDDADWNCGGTVAKLSAAGANVVYIVATDGEAGSNDPDMTPERLVEIRRREQKNANDILGVSETVYFGYGDGKLHLATDVEEKIGRLIRRYRPKLVLTFDPAWPDYVMHPDHRAVAIATIRAVTFSDLTLTYTCGEKLDPFRPGELLLFEPRRPNVWVNISKHTYSKLDALAAHRSQMEHLLPGWLHDIMYRVVDAGDNIATRSLTRLLHPSFSVETFRRHPITGLLR